MSGIAAAISLFVLLCFLIGLIGKEVNKKTGFPYTPLLLSVGILWGGVAHWLGQVGHAALVWNDLDPHSILLIFIPVLIFESAFGTDWHTFKRSIGQVLLLAVPGLLIGTVLTAIVIKYVLQYDDHFSWSEALMFGSILSATDPVAVVALLKELGVSKRLSTLIEGESLLNDGTALVAFEVFLEIALGESLGGDDIIMLFVRLSIGGPLIGIACGVISSWWLKRIYDDPTLEIAVTFLTCYITFWIAELSGAHVSGILALVSLGFYMSGVGKTYISVRSENDLHAFWKFMGWTGETLIFVLSGVIIGNKVFADGRFEGIDFPLLLVFYIMLTIIRYLIIALFYPVMKSSGYGTTWQDSFVMAYGGLRGAVGLTLALIVFHEEELNDRLKELVLFHTAGIATLTLMVNGTTTGYWIRKLGLQNVSEVKENMLKQFVKLVVNETEIKVEDLKQSSYLESADWELVQRRSALGNFLEIVGDENADELKRLNTADELLHQQRLETIEMRHRFLAALKGSYWHEFEEGQCSNQAVLILVDSVDWAIDAEEDAISDWKYLKKSLVHSDLVKFYLMAKGAPVVGKYFDKNLYHSMALAYDVSSAYVSAHHHTQETMKELVTESHVEILSTIIRESEKQIVKCELFIEDTIQAFFKDINKDIQTKKATYALLNLQRALLEDNWKNGVIDDKEYNQLNSIVSKKFTRLELKAPGGSTAKLSTVVRTIRFFDEFSNKWVKELDRVATISTIGKGDTIFEENQPANGFYILLNGKVWQIRGELNIHYETGDVVAFLNLLPRFPNTFSKCVSSSFVRIAFIPTHYYMNELEKRGPRLMLEYYTYIIYTALRVFPDKFEPLKVHDDFIARFLRECLAQIYFSGSKINLESGGIIAEGSISNEAFKDFQFIAPEAGEHKADGKVVVLHFSEHLYEQLAAAQFDMSKIGQAEHYEVTPTARKRSMTNNVALAHGPVGRRASQHLMPKLPGGDSRGSASNNSKSGSGRGPNLANIREV